MARRAIWTTLAGAWLIGLAVLAAFLAEGRSPPPAAGTDLCDTTGSTAGPFDMLTYEAEDWQTTYSDTLELAALNLLLPEVEGFALPELERGPRSAGSDQLGEPYIPPTILKAIAWIESSWIQADYTVPYGAVGPVLISRDCGYGIMQITSGMQNTTGIPTLTQAMIGGHYAFNIARGAFILAQKWNLAPEYRPQVGERDPYTIEDWYYAVWGYNGFAFKNHPLNPSYDWPRIPYSCGPADDGFGHNRTKYPYQELVFGCMERPPQPGGQLLWQPQEAHLPDPSDPAVAAALDLANWYPCAVDFDCAAMDIPTPNPSHQDQTAPTATAQEILGQPSLNLSQGLISLAADSGSQSDPTEITVANSGSGVLVWRATASEPWLQLSRFQGVSLGQDLGALPSSLELWVDASDLSPGTYSATVTFESLYADGVPMDVVVTLQVAEPPPTTPTPTPSVTPSVTPSATPSVTPSATPGKLPKPKGTPTPTPTPTPTATPTPTPTPPPLYGDANCDDGVDAVDSLLVLRHVAGIDPLDDCLAATADVNCDGKISAVDALIILRYVAGLEPDLPAGC